MAKQCQMDKMHLVGAYNFISFHIKIYGLVAKIPMEDNLQAILEEKYVFCPQCIPVTFSRHRH